MNKEKTGILIREARIAKHYTQSELGDLLGVTNKAVSRWENGESFPDIGILENLSQILEIKIQDLVIGEIQSDSNVAVHEIVRLSKLQEKLKTNQMKQFVVGCVCLLYSCMLGYLGLIRGNVFEKVPVVLYTVSLAVILFLIGYKVVLQKEDIFHKANRIRNRRLLIASISLLWIFVMTNVTWVLAGNKISIFHLEIQDIGIFMAVQLMIAFLLNLLMLIFDCYQGVKGNLEMSLGRMFSFVTMYLAIWYGDILHRLSVLEDCWRMFLTANVVVLGEMVLFLVFVKRNVKSE